jgi:hypothetical protein
VDICQGDQEELIPDIILFPPFRVDIPVAEGRQFGLQLPPVGARL